MYLSRPPSWSLLVASEPEVEALSLNPKPSTPNLFRLVLALWASYFDGFEFSSRGWREMGRRWLYFGRVLVAHRDAETHRDTQRHTETHRDTQRHTETHRDTQRHTETHRDTHTHTHTHPPTHPPTHTRLRAHGFAIYDTLKAWSSHVNTCRVSSVRLVLPRNSTLSYHHHKGRAQRTTLLKILEHLFIGLHVNLVGLHIAQPAHLGSIIS